MTDKRTIVGVFTEEEAAVNAYHQLIELGFDRDEISVLAENPERYHVNSELDVTPPHDMGKGAATGAITGGMVGGFGALIASIGALAIPGIGPFLAAGPIAATITGLLAGGAVGGALGALLGLGINKDEAKLYEENLKDGSILVIVEAENGLADDVTSILHKSTGPRSIIQSPDESIDDGPRFAAGSDEDSIHGDPSADDANIPAFDDPDDLDRLDDDVPPYAGDPLNDRTPLSSKNELDSET